MDDFSLAIYMALHGVMVSAFVFGGAALGGYLLAHMPAKLSLLGTTFEWGDSIFGVFAVSAMGRPSVALFALRRLEEVRTVAKASVGELIFRMARFHAVSVPARDIVNAAQRRR